MWRLTLSVILGILSCCHGREHGTQVHRRHAEYDDLFGLPVVESTPLRSRREANDNDDNEKGFIFNRTLVITTMPFEPLVMLRSGAAGDDAEDFSGYCKDLLDMMAEDLNFTYVLRLPTKEKNETAGWRDMFHELQDGKADMALTGITVTTERKKIVDFTAPFLYSGLAILYLKPFFTEPPWYAFVTALSWRVWLCLIGIYFLAALVFWMAARLSPEERAASQKPPTSNAGTQTGLGSHVLVHHILNDRKQDPLADYTIGNCLWFLIAALLFRQSPIQPKSAALKVLTVIWWFFSLLLLLLYVHVIAEAYATTVNVQPIDSVEDLARQNVVKYGALSGGSTMEYFKKAKMALFNHMYETMAANPSLTEKSYQDGVNRVLEEDGRYAFIMESVAIDYYLREHCELRRLGSDIARASYSIATSQGSGLAEALSGAILKLQEDGRMWQLDTKWFSYRMECDDENEYIRDVGLPYLDLYNFGGAILLAIVGLTFGLIIALIESCILSIKTARNKHVSIRNQVVQDIRDSIRRRPQPPSSLLPTTAVPMPQPGMSTRFYEAEPLSITVPRLEIGPYDPQNTPDYNPDLMGKDKPHIPTGGVHVYPQQQPTGHPGPGFSGSQPRRQMRQQQRI